MRLGTLTNIAYVVTVALTLAGGATMLMASNALEEERAAVARRDDLSRQTAEVDTDLLRLSDRAREYIQTGKAQYLEDYVAVHDTLSSLEARVQAVRDIGAREDELAALSDAIRLTDALQDEQAAAIEAYQAGDQETARAYLFGEHYENELDLIDGHISAFLSLLDQRTRLEVDRAVTVSRQWRRVSEGIVLLTALIFLCVLYFILKRRILRPVIRLSDVVTHLAEEDYNIEMFDYHAVDEIGDMAQAVRIFRENGLERQRLEDQLAHDLRLRNLMSRMTQRMQACDTMREIAGVVRRFVPVIVPACRGRLYVLSADRSDMVEACDWLDPRDSDAEFSTMDCWALRRGAMHFHDADRTDVMCGHLHNEEAAPGRSVCIPLMAQREVVGLLYIELPDDNFDSRIENTLVMLAENIALSLANIDLRETLHEMAMADPLTGLANRRQLDEKLTKLLADMKRAGGPVSCIMIDIDHFKHFNDTYGHAAGDMVLREVGRVLSNSTREDGLAFRYGGEEFAVLLPGVEPAVAMDRAETIRKDVEALSVQVGDVIVGGISASFGVASTPYNGDGGELFHRADAALYKSKSDGRNRVTMASNEPGRAQVA